jgi:glycosyltransferase involved in cell wall biosynthesis
VNTSPKRKYRLVCLTSHPIQYQVPLFREIEKSGDIHLTVLFCSDISLKTYFDKGFRRQIEWDVPLLGEYNSDFLPSMDNAQSLSFFRPINYGLLARLRRLKPDAIWVYGYWRWTNLVAMVFGKLLGAKLIISGDVSPYGARRNMMRRLAKQVFFMWLRSVCDAFLVVGTLNRNYYLSHGVVEQKLVPFPFAVDNSFFRRRAIQASETRHMLRASLGIPEHHPVILYASKFQEIKCPHDLLQAFFTLSPDGVKPPDATLLFIGDGELGESLHTEAARKSWPNVMFLGFQNQTELPAYFDLCDIFVLPSEYEPWGLVVNEVMNAGSAIIVSDRVGCAPDLVQPGVNGEVFKANDVKDLRRVLASMLSDRAQLKKMGEASKRIIDEWGYRQDVESLRQLMARLCESESVGWD